MTTYPNIGLTLPTRGSAGSGTWGDVLDANTALLDDHDHTTGHGVAITPAAMNINADLPFSSLYAPTQLHRVQFSAVAEADFSGGTKNKSLFVSDGTGGLTANELYFRTSAGNNIKFTDGSSLNVATFAGGFSGDFSSDGAIATYDSATKRYIFETGTSSSHGWARLMTGGVRIGVLNDTASTKYVEHTVDAAIATQYTVTWPAALPASTSILTVNTSGVIATGPASLPSGKSMLTIDASGTISTSTPYTGTMTLPLAACAFDIEGAAQSAGTALLGDGSWTFGAAEVISASISLPVGAIITSYDIYANRGGAGTITVNLVRLTLGTKTTINTTTINSGTGMVKTAGSSTSLPHTVLTDNAYYIRVTCTNAANVFEHIEVRYTI